MLACVHAVTEMTVNAYTSRCCAVAVLSPHLALLLQGVDVAVLCKVGPDCIPEAGVLLLVAGQQLRPCSNSNSNSRQQQHGHKPGVTLLCCKADEQRGTQQPSSAKERYATVIV